MCALVLSLLGGPRQANAQQSANVIAPQAQIDLLGVRIGETVSHRVIARNDRSVNITISAANMVCGSAPIPFTRNTSFPVTLHPGDSVVLGSVAFTPIAANLDYVGYLVVDHTPKANSEEGEVRIHATSETDAPTTSAGVTATLDSSVFGPVLYGGTVVRKLTVRNDLAEAHTFRCVDFTIQDREQFSALPGQFPLTVAAHSSATILIAFKPTIPKNDGSNLFTTDVLVEPMESTDKIQPHCALRGIAFAPMGPKQITSITDTTQYLGMTSTEWQFAHDFTFQNRTQQEITITDAELASENAAMSLTSLCGASLPVTLAPGQTMSARISYTAPDMSVHYDKLVLSTENGAGYTFSLQAMRVEASAVKNGLARRQIALSIRPNPAARTVNIELQYGFKGDMAIYSSSGALVAEHKNATSWVWNASTEDSTHIAQGEYMLRVVCHDTDGVTLTRTEKIVLAGQ
ncbi:MAG: choice-of-anchor D domain-containing protein [Bacteroidetes bacterium]|nr:choice-of-anchor D domain-containing protein [Bacteroidota bacterium]